MNLATALMHPRFLSIVYVLNRKEVLLLKFFGVSTAKLFVFIFRLRATSALAKWAFLI